MTITTALLAQLADDTVAGLSAQSLSLDNSITVHIAAQAADEVSPEMLEELRSLDQELVKQARATVGIMNRKKAIEDDIREGETFLGIR